MYTTGLDFKWIYHTQRSVPFKLVHPQIIPMKSVKLKTQNPAESCGSLWIWDQPGLQTSFQAAREALSWLNRTKTKTESWGEKGKLTLESWTSQALPRPHHLLWSPYYSQLEVVAGHPQKESVSHFASYKTSSDMKAIQVDVIVHLFTRDYSLAKTTFILLDRQRVTTGSFSIVVFYPLIPSIKWLQLAPSYLPFLSWNSYPNSQLLPATYQSPPFTLLLGPSMFVYSQGLTCFQRRWWQSLHGHPSQSPRKKNLGNICKYI